VRVVVLAEYYPRTRDPVLGVWAHRQALAARDAGAEVRVLVLHRLLPPRAALATRDRRALTAPLRQPRRRVLDGLAVEYVPFVAPPREHSYARWGAWAAPSLAWALRRLRRSFPYDLVHAHYAVPAGDAVRRVAPRAPLVISVHGGDVRWTVHQGAPARKAVEQALAHARLVLANSAGTARRCAAYGARATRVIHLGADVPEAHDARPAGPPELVSVGHLVARKRHADVIRALWALRDRHPDLRYVIVGEGPEAPRLRGLAEALGVGERVELRGQLAPQQAVAAARRATLFVLPSLDEAFGVAYVEAMAGAVPAIGCLGEDGPEEIAAAGPGLRLVPPADVGSLAAEIDALLADDAHRRALGLRARQTVLEAFTWERCGRETVRAYAEVLGATR
jgi:teichuronic acid biosynthesis glycosyltransferase TuaC